MVGIRPMFPLGTVLFPHAMLPLHVFEPRYRALVRDVLDADGTFGVVLIERGSEVGGGDARFGIGTLARVVRAREAPDGRWMVLALGTRRVRVVRWLADDPYPRAEVEPLPSEGAGPRGAGADELDRAVRARREVLELRRRLATEPAGVDPVGRGDDDDELRAAASHDPERALFGLAALAPIGPLDAQRVLEQPGTAARGRLLVELLEAAAHDLRAVLGRGGAGPGGAG